MKKLNIVLGGVELLVAVGVSTLVGGALAIVKPAKLGAVKKIAVGLAGFAISSMAADAVTDYVDKSVKEGVSMVKGIFEKKPEEEEETFEEDAAE